MLVGYTSTGKMSEVPGPRTNIFQKMFPSVFKVETSDCSGTGFIINAQHAYNAEKLSMGVTCNHVVQNAESGIVQVALLGRATYTPFRFFVVERLRGFDLAFIGIVSLDFDLRQYAPELSQEPPGRLLIGEDVGTLGFPDVKGTRPHPSAFKGIVSAIFTDGIVNLIQTDMMIHAGCSGGPLFLTRTGKVIGVVASGNIKKQLFGSVEVPTNLSFAIPIDCVIDILSASHPKPSFRSTFENMMKQG